nr:NAD-dependent epimerase/dehydratase family protein [Planomonospora sp. ID82291]
MAEEQLCLAHAARPGCPTTVVALRYFTVYGPRQRDDMFIQRLLTAAATDRPIQIYGDGTQRRDFTYVDDAVAATIAAATVPLSNSVLNVGSGRSVRLTEVVDQARRLVDHPIVMETLPAANGDVHATWANLSAARRMLNWAPTMNLSEGVAAQLAWLQTHKPALQVM